MLNVQNLISEELLTASAKPFFSSVDSDDQPGRIAICSSFGLLMKVAWVLTMALTNLKRTAKL